MTEIVPHGYISAREAVDRLGRELIPEAWTGEEHDARSGLISEEEWLKIKDLPLPHGGGATGSAPPGSVPLPMTVAASSPTVLRRTGDRFGSSSRGGGAPGSAPAPKTNAAPAANAPHRTGDPSTSSYQAEHRARKRYENACKRLRAKLEAGELKAAILDPFKGRLHRASTALWRRHDADRMIEKGRAPIPYSPNTGTLVVKEFPVPSRPRTPLPTSKIREVVDALRTKLATKSITRPQQKDFVHKRFPKYRVTERQFGEIFQEVPVPTGRPKKSDKKV
jgi:hypothetical protein